MRHGFKAKAERLAAEGRTRLSVGPNDAINPRAYARLFNVNLIEFDELALDERHRRQLLQVDPDSWSGLTLKNDVGLFVVLNPTHGAPRQANTLTHEVAHVQLDHTPGRVDISSSGLMLLSDYPDDQEQEADWLAGALLLPRCALVRARRAGLDADAIAAEFGISVELCQWRLRMTGVDKQISR